MTVLDSMLELSWKLQAMQYEIQPYYAVRAAMFNRLDFSLDTQRSSIEEELL